jgi:hypothetical protein
MKCKKKLLQVYFTWGKSKIHNQILKVNASQQCAYRCAHYLIVQIIANAGNVMPGKNIAGLVYRLISKYIKTCRIHEHEQRASPLAHMLFPPFDLGLRYVLDNRRAVEAASRLSYMTGCSFFNRNP